MRRIPRKIASIAAAAAILVTPTMAAASTVSSAPAPSAWTTFSQLNPAGATALAGSSVAAQPGVALTGSAAAVQATDDGGYHNGIPLPVIAVWLAVIGAAIYIALIEKHHGHITILPNSPA
jgi:hypothetical protein